MAENDSLRDMIDKIIECDDQPNEDQLTELRKNLEQKVTTMKRRALRSRHLMIVGIVVFAIGYALVVIASQGHQDIDWLRVTSIGILIFGSIVTVGGAVGLFIYRGFGYVWARHDLHDAALMELSLQVQGLTQRIELHEGKS